MPVIKITQSDRMQSKTAEAGWYNATISEMKMQGSKSGKSLNFFTTFTLKGEYEGKEIKLTYNTETSSSSVLGTMQFKPYAELVNLIEAVILAPAPDDYDTDELIGQSVDVKLEKYIAEGNVINIITIILPEGTGTSQKSNF